VNAFLRLVRALPIETDDTPRHRVSDAIIGLGRQHGLTAYDATYVDLALRQGAPLATFDAAIRASAPLLGVAVLPKIS
jgi:predicted nucleic acid-binding protein